MVFELFSGDCFGCVIVLGHMRYKYLELGVFHHGISFFTGHCEEVSGADCNVAIFSSESFLDVVSVLQMFVLSNIESGVGVSCRSERFTFVICSSSRFFSISESKFAGITVDLMLIIFEGSLEDVARLAKQYGISTSFLNSTNLCLDISGLNDDTILSFVAFCLLEHMSFSSSQSGGHTELTEFQLFSSSALEGSLEVL